MGFRGGRIRGHVEDVPLDPTPRRLGLVPLALLGAALARRGPMVVVSLVVSAVTAIGLAILAFGFARRGASAPVHDVPLLASSALAWGGGFLHAFSASASALRRDRTDGIRDLFVTRTTSIRGYLFGRIAGLALLLAVVLGGGTLLVGGVAILAETNGPAVLRTMRATLASVVFVVAFSAVMAPIALAALGARTRVSGYVFLLLAVFLPELFVLWTKSSWPASVVELLAPPSALDALRASLAPGAVDPFRMVRALVALAVFAAIAVFFVRRDVLLLERE